MEALKKENRKRKIKQLFSVFRAESCLGKDFVRVRFFKTKMLSMLTNLTIINIVSKEFFFYRVFNYKKLNAQ